MIRVHLDGMTRADLAELLSRCGEQERKAVLTAAGFRPVATCTGPMWVPADVRRVWS